MGLPWIPESHQALALSLHSTSNTTLTRMALPRHLHIGSHIPSTETLSWPSYVMLSPPPETSMTLSCWEIWLRLSRIEGIHQISSNMIKDECSPLLETSECNYRASERKNNLKELQKYYLSKKENEPERKNRTQEAVMGQKSNKTHWQI